MSLSVNCEWNNWVEGVCSNSCGGGNQTNTRTIKVKAANGGTECDGEHTMVNIGCNNQECPSKGL